MSHENHPPPHISCSLDESVPRKQQFVNFRREDMKFETAYERAIQFLDDNELQICDGEPVKAITFSISKKGFSENLQKLLFRRNKTS